MSEQYCKLLSEFGKTLKYSILKGDKSIWLCVIYQNNCFKKILNFLLLLYTFQIVATDQQ